MAGNHSSSWWDAKKSLEAAERSAEQHADSSRAQRELDEARRNFERADREG